jgi:hypothetical protein
LDDVHAFSCLDVGWKATLKRSDLTPEEKAAALAAVEDDQKLQSRIEEYAISPSLPSPSVLGAYLGRYASWG